MNPSTKSLLKAVLCRSALLLAAVFLPCLPARANLRGPYTNDVNTLYLLHFDEAAGGSVAANIGAKGGNFITVTNMTTGNGLASPPLVTTLLGFAAYTNANGTNYGTAVACTNSDGLYDGMIGYDGNGNGTYQGDVQSSGTPSADSIVLTNLNIGLGGQTPFTIEALICPTVINQNQEIVCSDNYWANTTPSRGFQFKITNTGTLQFNPIPVSSGSISLAIPTSGTHKFVSGQWYHVAVTYDGTTEKLYWTQLDPSNMVANPLTSQAVAIGIPFGTNRCPIDIGNENRGASGECFRGLIDEVRISSVCRAANEMQFIPVGVAISPQPISQNIDDNQPVTFSVGASSSTLMGFQWRFKGTPISGAVASSTNASSYSVSSVDLTNAGNYDCMVTDLYGNSATSHVATLVVGAGNFVAHRFSFTTTNATTPITTPDSIGANSPGTNFGNAYVSGGTLVLDGTTGTYLQMPTNYLHGPQAVTLEFWANFGTSGNNDRVFDFGNTNGISLGVGGQPNNYLFFSPHSGTTIHRLTATGGTSEMEQTVSGSNTLDGLAMHVTCVVDPPDKYLAIYTNGVLEIANTNFSVQLAAMDDQLSFLGRSLFSADAYLNASIDEFRVYNGAMSPATIQLCDVLGAGILPSDGAVQFATQPADTTVSPGATATFTAMAVGHQPITYQWYSNSIPVSGATNATLSFAAPLSASGALFQVLATNTVTGTNCSAASGTATLTVHVPLNLTWAGTGASWDTASLNWTINNNASQTVYTEADSATFNDLGSGQTTVNLTKTLHPTTVAASGSTSYIFSGIGSIAGPASLTKSGASTLIIDTTNTYTGPTLVSGGTLQLGDGTYTGTIGSGSVTNNAAIVVSPGASGSVVLSNAITGSGSLTVAGSSSGTVTLAASNSYAGGTTVSAGSLHLLNAAALGNGGAVVSGTSAQLAVAAAGLNLQPLTLNGSGITNDGALRQSAYTNGFGGSVTLGSDTTIGVYGGAVLNLTNASGINGASANANLTLTGSGAGNVTGPLSLGTGNLTVGGGTWTVAPSNSFSGVTTINGGTLLVTGPLSFSQPPASFNYQQVTLNGGTLGTATNVTLNDGNIGIYLAANSTTAVNDANATLTISNKISGSASLSLTKTGPGKLVLSGANDFGGTLNVDSGSTITNDGAVVIANNAAIANILAVSGTPFIYIRNNNGGSSTLALDGTLGDITVAQDIGLAGRGGAVPAIENLAGDNMISGGFTLSIGGAYILQSDSGTLTLTQPWPYAPPANVTSARNLTLTGAGIITMAGAIQDVNLLGTNVPVNVQKSGSGMLNLPTANTYSGTTIVSNGVLSLTGAIGTNTTTVAGGLLVGNGTIAGPVTVLAAGAIEAGTTNTIGTLNLGGNLTLAGNTMVKIYRSAGTHDQFSGQTSVTYGGTLTVTNLGGTITTNDTFVLFSPGSSAGNFSKIIGSPGYGMIYSFTNGVLSVVAVNNNPPPIQSSVSGNTLTLSWPTNLYWILQSQTNNLGVGISTNWMDVAGSGSSTQAVININGNNPSVFYRLRHP